MRWSGQEISGDGAASTGAPALLGMTGLVRSVRTPEFQGVTFHEVTAKSALNRVPAASSMPFDWTVNPYRGCSHACVYCFARSSHRYLDLDAGADFDQQVIVKINIAEVLRAELARRSWRGDLVALGTNTDPYQRAEGRYGLMPGIIEALAASGTPLSILTKGTLLRRDLPLLERAAEHVPVDLSLSIAVFDDALQKAVEPGTPTAAARLATVRAAADAGFRVTVFLMPIMPWLTDSDAQLDDALARIAASGAARVVFGALHLRPGAKEWFLEWIEREHPELLTGYRRFYGSTSYAPSAYRRNLAQRMRPLLARHGLDSQEDEDQPEQRRITAAQAARARTAPSALDLSPQPALF
ncbi:Rv2578c family radical SAM protein [Brachybacterium sp. YJGR34]|uniref:Rv2578c family radical SAM protein n=1 Tax=Brachybacterium sp. YJGR34 TaxID=2059911 RepID=UPI000E0C0A12|nr:Rv2578c family radical SAM protein [Brachybacterium sp. YJGR34]